MYACAGLTLAGIVSINPALAGLNQTRVGERERFDRLLCDYQEA